MAVDPINHPFPPLTGPPQESKQNDWAGHPDGSILAMMPLLPFPPLTRHLTPL